MRSFAAFLVVVLAGCALNRDGVPPRQARGDGAQGIAFVDSAACAECHPREFEEWANSHHDLAMQPATSETVLGDFDNVTFTHSGVTSRFYRDGERYLVNTEGPEGRMEDFEILYTFGFDPLQQYLIPFPGGRLQCLTIAWDTEQKRWFHLYQDERIPPEDPLHWTGRYQTWNLMCAECHSTNLRKNYDRDADTYQTEWDEINVGCQSCHGPAEAHVKWARILPEDYDPRPGEHKLVVDFRRGDSRYQVDACARCHSRRQQVSVENLHGRPYLDDYLVSPLREGLYHADGQILDEVYVYGSFLQSKMYRRGVRCSDCHNPHSLTFTAEGNRTCTNCHQLSPPDEFPTLEPKNYDTAEHHFHPMESEGARCVTCHMPARTYMVVDPRRDHSFRVPRPDLSVSIGTPNACNDCHADKSAEWAAEAVARWYRSEQPAHYGEVFAAARSGEASAESPLLELASDPNQASIVRATALELMRNYGPDSLAAMSRLVRDGDPLVRAKAAAGLDGLPALARVPAAVPLLEDPFRAVRIEAARVLSSLPAEDIPSGSRQAFESALAEYEAVQLTNSDTPGGNLNLASLYAGMGENDRAADFYQRALDIDPFFLPAQVNLVTFYNQQGRNAEAEQVLREAIERSPDEGELRYSLGLLLAEEQRLEEAADSLGRAATLMPSRARVRYNYALALQHLGRRIEAERELLKAHRTNPSDQSIVHALAIFYIQGRRLDQALFYAEKLVELNPNTPGPRQLVEQIRSQMQSRF